MAATLQSQHAGDLPKGNLYADTGQEPNQDGTREEVGEESQAHESRQNQENRGHQRKYAGQRQILIRAGSSDSDQRTGEYGRGR